MSGATKPFDEHAGEYDSWFLKNRCVLESEVLLLKHVWKDSTAATTWPSRLASPDCFPAAT